MDNQNKNSSTRQTSVVLKKALPEEIIFTILARDDKGPETIAEWIKLSIRTQSADKLRDALEVAISMADQCNEINNKKRIIDKENREIRFDQVP